MANFEIDIELPVSQPKTAVIRLGGSLDSFALPTLERKIQELMREGRYSLVVNLQKLRFISSPGMGLFLGTLGELEKHGGGIVFTRISEPEVYDAMNLLGFFDVFTVCDEESEAIQKVAQGR